jgi:SAM-dependent methyltransferase
MSLFTLIGDILRGKTVLRSLSDRALARHVRLRGVTLDVGGGVSAYLQQLPRDDRVTQIVMDLQIAARPTVVATAEAALPFQSGTIDTVLLHNVIEHVFGYKALLGEVWRVMAPNGRAYISVPFLVPLHEWSGAAGYRDYHRLSAATLQRLLDELGSARIEPLEVGPFVAACHVASSAVPFRALRATLVTIGYTVDRLYGRLRRRRDPHTQISFVLGYVAVLRK